jgi:hypothetical protein
VPLLLHAKRLPSGFVQDLVLYRERSGEESFGQEEVLSAGGFRYSILKEAVWNLRAMDFE